MSQTHPDGLVQTRDSVVSELEKQLVGPADGPEELVLGQPVWRYMAGMLFPRDPEGMLDQDVEDEDTSDASTTDEPLDANVARAYDLLPASMGVSFYLQGGSGIRCRVRGARYEPVDLESLEKAYTDPDTSDQRKQSIGTLFDRLDEKHGSGNRKKTLGSNRIWSRIPLSRDDADVVVLKTPEIGKFGTDEESVLDGRARVIASFRPRNDGFIVTVTLLNTSEVDGEGRDATAAAMLFQSRFDVEGVDGDIGAYPRSDRMSGHEEDEELALTYRHRKTYGIGHGCAATWDKSPHGNSVRTIMATPMPSYEVKGLTNEIDVSDDARQALDIGWLSDEGTTTDELGSALEAFVMSYETWTERQRTIMSTLPPELLGPAKRIVDRQASAIERMRRGANIICGGGEDVLKAFRLSQSAMAKQFSWTANREGGPFELGQGKTGRIEVADPSMWYPFQLGYILLVIESLANPDSNDRDDVDLLWFPTGGGKTEAYLALAAFEMIIRRLRHGDSGTAVLMRYTLRLLTSQQFERCATLIASLEVMRREAPSVLGDAPFRLGLWAGGQLTPNNLDRDSERSPGAVQVMAMIRDDQSPENPFLLRACPRCGTRIIPETISGRSEDYGVRVDASSFGMFCPDGHCELHDSIPVSVVDEDLYRNPPSFVIGTIDKFARLAWVPESGSLLGRGRDDTLPPSLIIQDELHLINGPLGSIAGGYEAGIETILAESGPRPKYLASTATIQRASEQCRALYGRSAFVFPPSGLDSDDAFFSKENDSDPGRTYLGIMGNGKYSSLTSLIQVSAAAALAPTAIDIGQTSSRDSYWTQVIYHNSRQELGKTTTMLRDDVRTRLQILDPVRATERNIEMVEELSANLKGGAVSEAIERLQVEYPAPDVIDVVACTNMISVGVDIGRLGIMIVKGQPKNTAEYIQASSRVGRSRKRPPGIVVTIFSPLKPRDRSHFESFQPYHQALYRAVEPSSVTPFSAPARNRSLHAALVISLRHLMGWTENRDAGKFDPNDPTQARIIESFTERAVNGALDDEAQETREHVKALCAEWSRIIREAQGTPVSFPPQRQYESLLCYYPRNRADQGHWPTLNSMRHVDGETPFAIRGQD